MDLFADYHAHTNLSYCCDPEITPEFYVDIIDAGLISAAAITDHSMAIYFPPSVAWSWDFIFDSTLFDEYREYGNKRLEEHLNNLAEYTKKGIIPGLEAEMMEDGRLTFDMSLRSKIKVLIGSVHYLPYGHLTDTQEILRHWKVHVFMLLNSGIDIIGHPFRWMEKISPPDEKTIRNAVMEAGRAHVAMELNSHDISPRTDMMMLMAAAECGTKISLGTDTHHPAEAADFSYHMKIIRHCGLKLSDLNLYEYQPLISP